jgi:outer membrane protein TolC
MRAAKEESTGVSLDVREVENRIAYDVVRACYAYLLARKNLEVLESERASRQRQLEQVQARFDLEDATRLDVLRARVALANLAPEVLAAENRLQVSIASVNNTLGRPIDAPVEVAAELALEEPYPKVLRPEALLEIATLNRPQLRRYAIDRRVLEARIGVAASEVKPQIRANASFGVNTFATSNVSDLALHTWSAGFTFDWQLFDGFRTKSQTGVLRSQIAQNQYDESAYKNWWGPMGVAVIFGLTVATVLTLVIVPITYHSLDSFSGALETLPSRLRRRRQSGPLPEGAEVQARVQSSERETRTV